MPASLHIRSGALVAHRLLDVANEIDLARAEALWLAHQGQAGRRTRLATATANELTFGVPPTLLRLPSARIELDGIAADAELSVRVYDFGAIVIALRIPAAELSWSEFTRQFNALDRATPEGSPVWRDALRTVLDVIGPALHRPAAQHLEEDYLFAVVHAFTEPMTGVRIREQADIAALLSGETRRLSAQEAAAITEQAYSYFEDDLVVLTWDRAFVYEPRRDSDVIDIIEVANAQLLEMRYYDELLDAELVSMYDLVANASGGLSLLASRRAARLARRLYGLVAEVTQLTERVENSLQVTEDVYLARIYGAALELFRVPRLSAAVDRKLAIIRDTYTALYDEASSRRAELLELAIVLLIVFEIVLALAAP
ncbi:hypothetical protein [Lysobacter solisilvae (ex Woo and Kim 2020)]|uniref:RMD1 family protein n=1 Tax=Agrilutibacter terrestris TaxID=2865112 RepID=A0A7H0FX05_9GAMM|nr:hypothetical protein [Lysobacter terrestris]QNP40571.1 hypothetical protein H8B22_14065 [Lysobacter terrestris]